MSRKESRIELLIREELSALSRFALHVTRDDRDSEELVQRTCLRALENRNQYREMQKPRSWLFRIAQNIWLNELRARQIRERGFISDPVQDEKQCGVASSDKYTPDQWIEYHEVVNAVEALPEAQRLVLILVAVNGFSYAETAETLDIPIGTVMSRLSRARVAIGKQFLPAPEKSKVVSRKVVKSAMKSTVKRDKNQGNDVIPDTDTPNVDIPDADIPNADIQGETL